MASSNVTVRATTSDAIQFQLLAGTVGVDLTGVTAIELWLRDKAGGTTMTDNLTGKLSINGAPGGSVKWTPGTADLAAGSAPYSGYFRVRKSASSWYFAPEDSEFTVNVRSTF